MIRHGIAPYLECSSKGDKRFSALYARVKTFGGETIENVYQKSKEFKKEDGSIYNFKNWRDAKGKNPINRSEVSLIYSSLWDWYFFENTHLLNVIHSYTGVSDIFGQSGRVCQATEIWRIRNETAYQE